MSKSPFAAAATPSHAWRCRLSSTDHPARSKRQLDQPGTAAGTLRDSVLSGRMRFITASQLYWCCGSARGGSVRPAFVRCVLCVSGSLKKVYSPPPQNGVPFRLHSMRIVQKHVQREATQKGCRSRGVSAKSARRSSLARWCARRPALPSCRVFSCSAWLCAPWGHTLHILC